MFINRGKLKEKITNKVKKFSLSEIKSEVNLFDNFIIYRDHDEIKVYDRKCDHAGGRIISKKNEHICPMHNWKFNPSTGLYENGVRKSKIDYKITGNYLEINDFSAEPQIYKTNKLRETSIRFFNHAYLNIKGENFSFSTDPWAIGPAFNSGWWLKNKTKKDWISELNQSDFIYISHNHPDHLHPLTLSKLNKKIPIVVPNFITKSTEKYIDELGFENIQTLEFNQLYNLNETDLYLSILKSGDFREDSGIYFSNGKFTGLLSVDSNMINFEKLPKVDFYGSAFAGGASGYPLMFDNYTKDQKIEICKRSKNFVKKKKFDHLVNIKPKFFMPYAGFFQEKLIRDKEVFDNNQKNSIDDYEEFCRKNEIQILNVLDNDFYKFNGNELIKITKIKKEYFKDLTPDQYLKYFKDEFKFIDENYIKKYFLKSKFKENLLLYICLTDDDFKTIDINYLVDFSKNVIEFSVIDSLNENFLNENIEHKKLILKIRKESFLNTIYNKLPWEDLLIGFQCKVLRNPNVYNVNFWNHFTNIYITSKSVRSVTQCGSCQKIDEFFNNQILAI